MYDNTRGLYIAHSDEGDIAITGKMANRHGLIAGATGTGKTVTLQVMAETFSQAGVPCFMADMKGDLSGIAKQGSMSGFIEKRKGEFGIPDPEFQPCPVRFYDVFGEQGHPIRATISQMGPHLLSRLLGLNETQDGVLNILFRVADEKGLEILDLKDLRSMLDYLSKHAKEYTTTYGNVSTTTIGAIQRSLLQLENQGANKFFGEPSFDINDLLATENGRGVMSVLAADKLMMEPKLYSTFLLWMISELYSTLPEVGDRELPKLIFFFDEAHMLFDGTSKALTDKIEQVIRLIRSKGVGIYFISQLPTDLPDNILAQLGNRVQHALRAYTPRDQKAVKVAAETFRPNPSFKTEQAISELGTGEALVSLLDENGAPGIVQRAKILFPLSQIGAITPDERRYLLRQSPIFGKYDTPIDRVSAYEMLVEGIGEQEEAEEEQAEVAVSTNTRAGAGTSPATGTKRDVSSYKSKRSEPQEIEEPEEETEKETNKKDKKEKKEKGKDGLGSKVLKSVFTSITGTLGTIVGTAVSDSMSGTKTKHKTSAGQRIVKNATSSATRTVTRTITRDILGNWTKK